ncbi:MAG TPA: VOC family protein [Acidimicrobiales bacterium]|nr:VOC family protein [Acidimicrobiales bacterium]
MATKGTNTNTEFELRGFNHLALVARDMAETIAWYQDVLGMKLVKTLELPGGHGQHFFLDMGNGVDGIAFFWFPEAPDGVPGESLQNRRGVTAIGTMNHLAFDVPAERFDEYRQKLIDKGVEVTMIINHANSLDGGHKPVYDAATDNGDIFIRSMYFKDPNGTTLEFACWTKVLDESDVRHAPATARPTVDA